jgi:hypothetical protein
MITNRPKATFDIECFSDYFLAMFERIDTRERRWFDAYPGKSLDTRGIIACMQSLQLITFNGRNYDIPMALFAHRFGADCTRLKALSHEIIKGEDGKGSRGWQILKKYQIQEPEWLDHIDLQEIMPGMVSLKIYGGRMHCRKLQDLPYHFDASILPEQRQTVIEYCGNDQDLTNASARKFAPHLKLRTEMSAQYGSDLRSKSDAQIAEAVIRSELQKVMHGRYIEKPGVVPGFFKYRAPDFLANATGAAAEAVQLACQAEFEIQASGKVKMPEELDKREIRIGQGIYRMGIGGLHSSESSQAYVVDRDWMICDIDVKSFYPAIIIITRLFPKHIGDVFLVVFTEIFKTRLDAKERAKYNKIQKQIAETLKIVLNGSFGKFGNAYSMLFSPELLIAVTVTGQLVLLMLIAAIEAWSPDMHVISANTDGIVVRCRRHAYDTLRLCVTTWERRTGFEMEETRYQGIYSRDVNNYIAIKSEDYGVKLKGAYAPPEPVASSWPSPHNQICITAVTEMLRWGMPIERTIRECKDIRQFVEVRGVKGGSTWCGEYLGKAVRWIKARGGAPIMTLNTTVKGNHTQVAGTESCRPLMELPDEIPFDLDHDAYIRDAYEILRDIGVNPTGIPRLAER